MDRWLPSIVAGIVAYVATGPGHLKERDQIIRKAIAAAVAIVIFNL